MCGIYGSISQVSDSIDLNNKIREIAHRGPSEVKTSKIDNANFIFSRLAINGIENGSQPFVSKCTGDICLVNGEIYNHFKLKKMLEEKGHEFTTSSDCEVFLHGYEEYGASFPNQVNGMFAAAIWNNNSKKLYLARDRFGKKPLFFRFIDGEFEFGSELTSVLNFNLVNSTQLQKIFNIVDYLCSDSSVGEDTIIKNIRKVPAGGYVEFWKNENKLKTGFFYKIEEKINTHNQTKDAKEINELLNESIKIRLQAEAPLGVFLSSGIDSAIVTSKASILTEKEFPVFVLGFKNKSFDESDRALEIAKKLNLKAELLIMDDEVALDVYSRYIKKIREPLNDPAVLGQMYLSENAKKFVDVVLTGDGGDELLLGYPTFKLNKKVEKFKSIFKVLSPFMNKIKIKSNDGYFDMGFKFQRFLRGSFEDNILLRDNLWRGAFNFNEVLDFVDRSFQTDTDIYTNKILNNFEHLLDSKKFSLNQALSIYYLKDYLLNTVLVKVDRSTMAFGLEARCPLLDFNLVEALLNFEEKHKDKFFSNKKIFMDILKSEFPIIVNSLSSKKHGMGIPVSGWLRTILKSRLEQVTHKEFIIEQKIFCLDSLERLKNEHFFGVVDRRKELWAILMYQEWYLNHLKVGL